MQDVIIVIHLIVVLALVGVVLLQRSEGGGLGIGGGSGFMSARGAADALTRTTGFLAAAFFVTSLALSIMAQHSDSPADILDRVKIEENAGKTNILDQLGGGIDNSGNEAEIPVVQDDEIPSASAPEAQVEPSNEATAGEPSQTQDDSKPATDN